MTRSAVIGTWSSDATATSSVVVLPDGCSDLIAELGPDGHRWFVSSVQNTVETTPVMAGRRMRGYRFRPGTAIEVERLVHSLRFADWDDEIAVWERIDSFTRLERNVNDALATLAAPDVTSVARAAQASGVSPRTLQRMIQRETALGPAQWMQLARARRAGRAIVDEGQSLADIAFEHGFADQAHMTRAIKQWFGLSPARLRRSNLGAQLHATGYG